jgi:hypothetical protein
MTFELPTAISTAAELRDLEQNAPNVTPKAIRAALVKAAAELEQHEKRAADAIRYLEEAMALRVGQMDSHSRATEVDRQVKAAMKDAVARLRG